MVLTTLVTTVDLLSSASFQPYTPINDFWTSSYSTDNNLKHTSFRLNFIHGLDSHGYRPRQLRSLHSIPKPTIKTQNPQFLTFQSQKTYKIQLSLKKSSISTINRSFSTLFLLFPQKKHNNP
ncbi:hypothetical protein MS2017_1184 [Bathymodiolus thermophilus thioautotrophic gill symbiont]|uniref:Uncharacterized protein n=1 Tax=Bathymodiolus thermophilus thioautotrophic gill symbiont TaxID=2360 RepID=A0A3G3IMT6_9GAMM|nr:hypothetical protein MS2017_1184 [Bathymodiolus thermophilus thioautotrophic gill symbiont]